MRQTNGHTNTSATEAELTATARMSDVDIYVHNVHKCAEHTQWLQFPAHIDMTAERYIGLRLENEHFNVLRMDSRLHIKQSFNNDKQERAPTAHPGITTLESKNGTARLQSREPESIVNMSY